MPSLNQWFTKLPKVTIYNTLFHNDMQTNNFKNSRTKRGNKSNKAIIHDIHDCKHKLLIYLQDFSNKFSINNLKYWIFSLKKKYIIQVFEHFKNNLTKNMHFNYLVLDLIITRAYYLKINLNKPKDLVTKYCVIHFCNPVLNNINFHKIYSDLYEVFPIDNVLIKNAFNYSLPVGRKIFNYNYIAKNFDKFMEDSFCNCNKYSKYIDQHHGHVITGDLNIVDNSLLRNIMIFGAKFKLPSKLTFNKIIASVISDLNKFIYKLAVQFSYPIEAFNEWKNKVLYRCVNSISDNFKFLNFNHKELNTAIKNLQKEFVITYIDKAANNYAIICKKLYANIIFKQMDHNSIFKPLNVKASTITKKIIAFYKLLKLKINKINYPYVMIVPKFHKTPIAFRSITCGTNIYFTIASNVLLKLLTQILEVLKTNKISIINSSYSLITSLNNNFQYNYINTYDFKDLYNNIDIEDLNKVILKLYFQVNSCKALNIKASYFKKLLNFVTKNCYLLQNNTIYKQVKGVPQGGPSSSVLANLYLHFFEINYINDNDFRLYRYIDDIIIFSNNDIETPSFYPQNLELIKSNSNSQNVNFLDINFSKLKHGVFVTDLYDKRNDYKFEIVKSQYYNSCLHKNVFKNIILNNLIRINRLCSKENINKQLVYFKKQLQKYKYPNYLIDCLFNRFSFFILND